MIRSDEGLGRAIAGTLVSTAIPALAGVASSVALARTLGPLARGEFATVLLWPLALSILGDLGLGFALSFYVSRDPESAGALWTIGLVSAFALGSLLAVAGVAFLRPALTLSEPARLAFLLTLAALPASLAAGFGMQLLLGGGQLAASNVVRGSSLVLYAAGVVGVAGAHRASVPAYAAVWCLSQIASFVAAAVLVRRRLGVRWNWRPSLIRPLGRYGLRVYASSLAAQTTLRLDQLLMTVLGVTAQLGLYVVAVAVASFTAPFFSALSIVALHRVTRAASVPEAVPEVRGLLQVWAILGLPLVLVGLVAAWPGVPLIFGEAYRGSTLAAQILLSSALFQGANAMLGNVLRGLGLPGRPAVAEGVGTVLTITLLLALLPRWGASGAAASSLLASSAVSVLLFRFLSQATGLRARDLFRADGETPWRFFRRAGKEERGHRA